MSKTSQKILPTNQSTPKNVVTRAAENRKKILQRKRKSLAAQKTKTAKKIFRAKKAKILSREVENSSSSVEEPEKSNSDETAMDEESGDDDKVKIGQKKGWDAENWVGPQQGFGEAPISLRESVDSSFVSGKDFKMEIAGDVGEGVYKNEMYKSQWIRALSEMVGCYTVSFRDMEITTPAGTKKFKNPGEIQFEKKKFEPAHVIRNLLDQLDVNELINKLKQVNPEYTKNNYLINKINKLKKAGINSFNQLYAESDQTSYFKEKGMQIFNKKNLKIDVLYYNKYSMNIHIKMSKDCDAIFRRFLFLVKAVRGKSDCKWFVNEQLSKPAANVRDILSTAKDKSLIHGFIVSASGATITFSEVNHEARKRHEVPICEPVSQLLTHCVTADGGKISYDPAVWERIRLQETKEKPRAGRFHVRFYDY